MATKKNKGQVQEQKNTTKPDDNEVRRAWINSYVAPRNTCARVATAKLIEGTTLQALMEICKQYNSKQTNKQAWGEKLSDLTSHCRWLSGKGFRIEEKDGRYKLSA